MLSVATAPSSSDGVLNMLNTSGFVDNVIFAYYMAMGQNQARRYILKKLARWRYQVDVRELTVFGRVRQRNHQGQRPPSTTALTDLSNVDKGIDLTGLLGGIKEDWGCGEWKSDIEVH